MSRYVRGTTRATGLSRHRRGHWCPPATSRRRPPQQRITSRRGCCWGGGHRKFGDQPMGHRSLGHGDAHSRCGAKTRAGTACQSPPVAGRKAVPAAWWAQPRCSARQPERQLPARGLDYGGDRGAPMAAIARPGVCENRNRPMSKKLSTPAPSVASGKVPAPVRVRLKRVNCNRGHSLSAGRAGSRMVASPAECLRHCLKRVRSRFPTAANCSGTAAEQRDFRDRCERQLGVHRGRQAPG